MVQTCEKTRIKPRIPSGFLELLPSDQIIFNKMFDTIRQTYESFGFKPIETPAIELTEVLLTKSGGETEKQVYKIDKEGSGLSLHFDLTVPLARYVAEHKNNLNFPFRRYQMQKVWRGEKKQEGRFREFYQCDIDIIGTTNILADAEIPSIIFKVFRNLGFERFTIRINNRKILNGLLEYLGITGISTEVLRAVDKLDKKSVSEVVDEISYLGVAGEKIDKIINFVNLQGTNSEIISSLRSFGIESSMFDSGVSELESVVCLLKVLGVPESSCAIDLSIARGLDYYTSTVYETRLNDYPEIGSICSGGRFDNLVECYTDEKLPGVGISIGLTRLFYKLREIGFIKAGKSTVSDVLVLNMGQQFMESCLGVANVFRDSGISTEIYFDPDKIKKQLRYAERSGIPFVVFIGEEEFENGLISIKHMGNGDQRKISVSEALLMVKNEKNE